MRAHFRSVALGQEGFILDPLSRIWVDYWSKAQARTIDTPYKWRNISEPGSIQLDPEDEKNWVNIWKPIMARRYNIEGEKYEEMIAFLKKNVSKFGVFKGAAWSRIWRRDYLGNCYE